MRILLVENQENLASFIESGLHSIGYVCDRASDYMTARTLLADLEFDAILLDAQLPDGSGLSLVRLLRSEMCRIPILILSASDLVTDKITILDAGADDYMTKPLAIEELYARMRAIMRRCDMSLSAKLKLDDLEMDLFSQRVTRANRVITLTRREFALLEYLLRNPGRVLSRAAICEHVWTMPLESQSNIVDAYIKLLRKKIDQDFTTPLIHTVVGMGYILKVPEGEPCPAYSAAPSSTREASATPSTWVPTRA